MNANNNFSFRIIAYCIRKINLLESTLFAVNYDLSFKKICIFIIRGHNLYFIYLIICI